MRVKVLSGHLTTVDKKVIKQMIDLNMTEGGYKGKSYFISFDGLNYNLKQVISEWDCDFMRNKKVKRIYTATFKI